MRERYQWVAQGSLRASVGAHWGGSAEPACYSSVCLIAAIPPMLVWFVENNIGVFGLMALLPCRGQEPLFSGCVLPGEDCVGQGLGGADSPAQSAH